jgi:hypothetical protein
VNVFTKNRDRLLDAEVAAKFMAAVLAHREIKPLLSSDHFSVAGPQRRARLSRREAPERHTHTRAPPIPMPSSTAKVKALQPSLATSGMRWPKTDTA